MCQNGGKKYEIKLEKERMGEGTSGERCGKSHRLGGRERIPSGKEIKAMKK